MKLHLKKSNILKSSVLVFLILLQSDYCLTDIRDEKVAERFLNRGTTLHNMVYKSARIENYNLIEVVDQSWVNGEWISYHKETFTHDEQGNETESLNQSWNGSEWVNSYKETYTHDEQGNKTESLHQSWVNSEWVNEYKGTYTYDEQGNETESLGHIWKDDEWVNVLITTNTYDDQGNLTEQHNQSWKDGEWINSLRSLYTYDSKTYIAENISDMPARVLLSPNYPNPFNPSTTIGFSLPEAGLVDLVIFNVMGQKVRKLLSKHMAPGIYSIVWDGCDDRGIPVSAGIYFSRLHMNNSSVSGRMMLVK